MQALCAHAWRGNVRELQNVIEHVAVLAEPGTEIRAEELPLNGDTPPVAVGMPASIMSGMVEDSYHAARNRVISQFEVQYLQWLVDKAEGNLSKAARIAGVDRTTLYRMMERHGLHRAPATWVERNRGTGESIPADAAMADGLQEAV
jgi:DNA-binding NtrC family response regulator